MGCGLWVVGRGLWVVGGHGGNTTIRDQIIANIYTSSRKIVTFDRRKISLTRYRQISPKVYSELLDLDIYSL